MDWIHCNACFFQPGQLPKRDFILTSCGHLFCLCCERSGTTEQCKMCGIKCTTTPLSAEMAKEVQQYFEEPEIVQQQLTRAMEFQKTHRQKLNEYYRRVVEKYQRAKTHIKMLEEENKAMKIEIERHKRIANMNLLTPPQPQPKSQLPLFSKNSEASQVIRMGMSQMPSQKSTFFATPSSSSQQYRTQRRMTPSTPMSDTSSNSPASVTSRHSYRSTSGGLSLSQQLGYKPGLTPPINRMRLMNVNSQHNRNNQRY